MRYDIEDGIAKITVDRAHRENSLDLDSATVLHDLIERCADDYSRAVVVTGAGSAFCTGVDSQALVSADDRASYHLELSSMLDAGFRALGSMSKPVIAAVPGAVSGAGLGLVLSCDLIITAHSGTFTMGYAASGLTPDSGVSWLLPRAIGQQRALDLALSGRVLDAPTAVEWGLATMVVPDHELMGRARAVAASIISGPSWSFGQARRLIRRSWESTRDESGGDEAVTIARAAIMPDAQSAVARLSRNR